MFRWKEDRGLKWYPGSHYVNQETKGCSNLGKYILFLTSIAASVIITSVYLLRSKIRRGITMTLSQNLAEDLDLQGTSLISFAFCSGLVFFVTLWKAMWDRNLNCLLWYICLHNWNMFCCFCTCMLAYGAQKVKGAKDISNTSDHTVFKFDCFTLYFTLVTWPLSLSRVLHYIKNFNIFLWILTLHRFPIQWGELRQYFVGVSHTLTQLQDQSDPSCSKHIWRVDIHTLLNVKGNIPCWMFRHVPWITGL